MHEQSETIQLPSGRWVNVIGGTHNVLAPRWPFEAESYTNLTQALFAARNRSMWESRLNPDAMDPLNNFLAAVRRSR